MSSLFATILYFLYFFFVYYTDFFSLVFLNREMIGENFIDKLMKMFQRSSLVFTSNLPLTMS